MIKLPFSWDLVLLYNMCARIILALLSILPLSFIIWFIGLLPMHQRNVTLKLPKPLISNNGTKYHKSVALKLPKLSKNGKKNILLVDLTGAVNFDAGAYIFKGDIHL